MNIHSNRLEQVVPHVYVAPTYESIDITLATSERIDELFAESKELYIAESGMRDEYDFQEDIYLESFSSDEKINEIISTLQAELACYKTLVAHYQNKSH